MRTIRVKYKGIYARTVCHVQGFDYARFCFSMRKSVRRKGHTHLVGSISDGTERRLYSLVEGVGQFIPMDEMREWEKVVDML